MKVYSNLFRMMYGFMAIQAIEIGEMAFWKKLTLQKSCYYFSQTIWRINVKKEWSKCSSKKPRPKKCRPAL